MIHPFQSHGPSKFPRVVIVGGGFGGLKAAQALAGAAVEILLIDKTNHHLFQPLLYQVATAILNPSEIASPIRQILQDQANVTVILGQVIGVNLDKKNVFLEGDADPISYDYLILASGLEHSYHGHDEWRPFAMGLKTLGEATEIRAKILKGFERAEVEVDPIKQRELLTFVMVGAGPTGCEMAGAIIEMARMSLKKNFRHIDPRSARVVLIEGGPRILPTFPESLSAKAHAALKKMGVEVRVGQPVELIDSDGVVVKGERIPSRTIIWSAGVKATPLGSWLGAPMDRQGRIQVEPNCSVPGHPDVFAVGDIMSLKQDGKLLPGVAQVALQQGHYVGQVIRAAVDQEKERSPFRYHDHGNMAAIGRNFAIMETKFLNMSGYFAFLAWALIHILFLIYLQNRVLVFLRWTWMFMTKQRMVRLIIDKPKSSRLT